MKTLATVVATCLALPATGLAGAGEKPENCASVSSVKADEAACTNRTIRIKAHLVSTQHGAYLADSPADQRVLGVRFSDLPQHRQAIEILEDKLRRASLGRPYADVFGEFEGHLVLRPGKPAQFEIHSEEPQL